MPNDNIRELTAGELGAICGGTALMADGGENNRPGFVCENQSPMKPAEFVIITVSSKTSR